MPSYLRHNTYIIQTADALCNCRTTSPHIEAVESFLRSSASSQISGSMVGKCWRLEAQVFTDTFTKLEHKPLHSLAASFEKAILLCNCLVDAQLCAFDLLPVPA
jgi:hypothetical protein